MNIGDLQPGDRVLHANGVESTIDHIEKTTREDKKGAIYNVYIEDEGQLYTFDRTNNLTGSRICVWYDGCTERGKPGNYESDIIEKVSSINNSQYGFAAFNSRMG